MSKEPKTLLLTGFGPFRKININPSWLIVQELEKTWSDHEVSLITKEIPVTYDYVENEIPAILKTNNPDLVIHIGVKSIHGHNIIDVESSANSCGYDKPDANNCIYNKDKQTNIECLHTSLNLEKIVDRCKECTPSVSISDNAGRYLCEFIYYTSMKYCSRVLFIHIPQISDDITLEMMTNTVQKILQCCVDQLL